MAARDPMASMVGVNRQLLQPGALYSSTHVQEWLSPAGQRRSMPTNCPEDSTVINNNTLRSCRGTRGSRYALTGSNPAAGNHFSACTLVDNWSEEQASSKHAPRNAYRLQPPDETTEYRRCISTTAAERQQQLRVQQLQQCYLTPPCRNSSRPSSAPQHSPASDSHMLSAHRHSSSSTSISSSSRPCTSSSCRDAAAAVSHSSSVLSQKQSASHPWATFYTSTLQQQRQQQQHMSQAEEASTGRRRCWSASAAGAESVCRTTLGRQQRLEFQDPPVGDARGRVLANTATMKQRDAALAAACSARLQANRQSTSRWASMYSREFLQQEFVLRVEQQQQQQQRQ